MQKRTFYKLEYWNSGEELVCLLKNSKKIDGHFRCKIGLKEIHQGFIEWGEDGYTGIAFMFTKQLETNVVHYEIKKIDEFGVWQNLEKVIYDNKSSEWSYSPINEMNEAVKSLKNIQGGMTKEKLAEKEIIMLAHVNCHQLLKEKKKKLDICKKDKQKNETEEELEDTLEKQCDIMKKIERRFPNLKQAEILPEDLPSMQVRQFGLLTSLHSF